MAYMDKIYGTRRQEREFRAWCEEHFPEALDYFYEWKGEWLTDNHEHPITNFPQWIDKKLLKMSPPSFVLDRIKDQYGVV